jgi:Haem-NO-binding
MVDEPRYIVSEAYADERFMAIVERACIHIGLSREALLRDLTVETPIHEVVRVALPNALPPQLKVSEIGERGLEIVYSSPRRLCAMLRGLVEGTAQVYDEIVQVDERACMEHGGKACTFDVLFA